ncbi:hypothetical protein [Cohaesibacter celericrescens]|uniref:hypothetical protein n=1 Tax=Cohaesibacter celericrescens TaxID=2067669 RepID=UPI00356ADAE0
MTGAHWVRDGNSGGGMICYEYKGGPDHPLGNRASMVKTPPWERWCKPIMA